MIPIRQFTEAAMQTLNQDIKDKTFRRVYLLFGDEPFLVNSYKKRLREAIAGDDTMNYNYFEGKGQDVKEIISLADTMPFFAERRLVLIDGSGFFKSSAPEELVNYIPEIPESTCMVFVENEVDKRNKLYKKVKDNGYAAELKKQDADQLMRWAAGILSKDGKKITRQVMEYFMERTGDGMENIRMELEKLICYTMGREVIKALEDGNYNYINRAKMSPRESLMAAYDADVFLSSANALTDDGILINIDGNSNRVSCIAQGPKKVIFIVGINKICSDLDSAMKRARNIAAPANAQRFDIKTPCKETGKCFDCKSPDTICCQFLITRYSRHKDRIHVILVNDTLGF